MVHSRSDFGHMYRVQHERLSVHTLTDHLTMQEARCCSAALTRISFCETRAQRQLTCSSTAHQTGRVRINASHVCTTRTATDFPGSQQNASLSAATEKQQRGAEPLQRSSTCDVKPHGWIDMRSHDVKIMAATPASDSLCSPTVVSGTVCCPEV